MCGIAGVLSLGDQAITSDVIKTMTDSIIHRGPDGEGQWCNASFKVGLGHRRLSILDLSEGGRQPMHYADNRFTLTFNGEIYNYIELRTELIKEGYVFKSETDTEVLLAMYHKHGAACLKFLEGMFAFAIWDEQEQELFCARDRFGEKPFFYTIYNNQFFFASEMKSLFAAGIPKVNNNEMICTYLIHSIVENPLNKEETFYKNIFKLEAASSLIIRKNGKLQKGKYWEIDLNKSLKITPNEGVEQFQDLFENAVRKMLRSDVPVGSSLSGGLDSSAVVATINKLIDVKEKQKTFSARFKDKKFDEGTHMLKVIDAFNVDAHFTYPSKSNIIDEFDLIMHHQEEPFISASIIAQWEVQKLAKANNVTVLLDGQGADEILAGYHKYFETYLRELLLMDKASFEKEKNALNNLHNYKLNQDLKFYLNAYMPGVMRFIGTLRREIFGNNNLYGIHKDFFEAYSMKQSPFTSFNGLNEFLKFDTTIYGLEKLLRFSDRNSMAHSREVRLPFLHHELVSFVFSLPSSFKINQGWTKFVLRKAMDDVLPKEITWRVDKMGYQPPQKTWESDTDVQQRIKASKSKLIQNKILNDKSNVSDFKILETAYLF